MTRLGSFSKLLAEARERVLCADEMQLVVDRLFGAESWVAVQFSTGSPGVKQCEFVSLLKQYGFDVRRIKTNLELFAEAAEHRLTESERDELMRTVYGVQSPIYRRWAANPEPIGKELEKTNPPACYPAQREATGQVPSGDLAGRVPAGNPAGGQGFGSWRSGKRS